MIPGGSDRRAALVLGAALLVLLLAATLSLMPTLRGVERSADLVARTYQVIGQAEDLLSTLKDAETGQRGYLLTGRASYLEPYRAALTRLDATLAALRRLAANSPAQTARLPGIEALAADKRAELERTVALAQGGDRAAALAVVETDAGKADMDRLRAALAAFEAEEHRSLTVRRAALAASERNAILSALATAASAVAAATGAAWLLFRRGQRAEAALSRTEEELAARLAELRAIYDSAPVGLAFSDRDLRFIAINERMAAINGVPAADHLGRTPRDVLPDIAAAVEPIYERVLATGEPLLGFDIRTATASTSGTPRDYVASYWPVRDAAGAVAGINVAVLDVTSRKAAEDEVRRLNASLERQVAERTADLAAANAQLESFAYTVSHDLRAPLRGMEGFARILLDDFAEQLGPRGGRYAERIVAAAQRMDGLIADLLTFSLLQRAKIALRILDPAALVRTAAEDARAAAGPGNAEIAVAGSFPAVLAEPVVLGHVLANLLSNAVKFRKPGEPAHVRVWAEPRGGRVRIWVEDEGIGIAPEHHAMIFGVFERLHGQESYPGTGIGLAIVKAGAARLGGAAGVESRAGAGARFWVELATVEPATLDSYSTDLA